ncbi:hypothetical protein VN12_03440 [Pirellula sp. SH-Sr6A]|uniref:type IV pilus modification PilV family protein n=1 Tax=Pirellula sp. SH-Sr6A TaxID=1632865 RepID=UPI00078CB5E5|nr:hypothetical protein [Pirellula sp. SH-Sr6A]AMV31145.1 hypothetical protein VN12_03440 [Pirellula sp. SH-Sr6A]
MTMHPTGSKNTRSGLTVVEVLFALSIILVGLIGIAAMVPFAARQANESYATVQSVVAGDSAVAMAESQAIFKPTFEKPWQVIDDELSTIGDSNKTFFYSFTDLYNNNGRKGDPSPANPKYQYDLLSKNLDLLGFDSMGSTQGMEDAAWLAVNQTLGTSFYMDPSFWGTQDSGGKVMQNDANWLPFRRTRFPYYADGFGPNTPRALRVTLHDANHVGLNGGWMKQPISRSTVTPGGDVVSIKPDNSQGFAMRRQMLLTPDPADPSNPNSMLPIQGTLVPTAPMWSALISPAESTPILEKTKLPSRAIYSTPAAFRAAMRNYVIPMAVEAYDLAIVVQKRRLLREIYLPLAQTPATVEGERIFGVTWDITTDEPSQSGTFEITLTQPPAITDALEAKLKAGDWLMLSRHVVHFYRDAANLPAAAVMRQKHKWYRVVSAPNSDVFPLSVRVSGGAWTWTTDEIQSAARVGLSLNSVGDSSTAYYQQTSATLIPNVVHVFERTMTVSY